MPTLIIINTLLIILLFAIALRTREKVEELEEHIKILYELFAKQQDIKSKEKH